VSTCRLITSVSGDRQSVARVSASKIVTRQPAALEAVRVPGDGRLQE
jgi:hypothetical protein